MTTRSHTGLSHLRPLCGGLPEPTIGPPALEHTAAWQKGIQDGDIPNEETTLPAGRISEPRIGP